MCRERQRETCPSDLDSAVNTIPCHEYSVILPFFDLIIYSSHHLE